MLSISRFCIPAALLLFGVTPISSHSQVQRQVIQPTEIIVIAGDHYGIYCNPNDDDSGEP